ncbi:hypothetical protein B566_EDAN007486 [Ephemera danica]|nr:hypothetical protein B566_EDAN007486 [Ephemera danica]
MLSYLGSKLILHPVSHPTSAEEHNEPFDFKGLNNDEILDRAKFYVQKGDIRQAVSYMNLLHGVAQFVSSGWLQEAVTYLEVTQVASALTSYSTLLVQQFID